MKYMLLVIILMQLFTLWVPALCKKDAVKLTYHPVNPELAETPPMKLFTAGDIPDFTLGTEEIFADYLPAHLSPMGVMSNYSPVNTIVIHAEDYLEQGVDTMEIRFDIPLENVTMEVNDSQSVLLRFRGAGKEPCYHNYK